MKCERIPDFISHLIESNLGVGETGSEQESGMICCVLFLF